ncbi:MAG: arsenic resistance N-acetyltransferase ArsN2 [Gammaproteobacteria bacterium]
MEMQGRLRDGIAWIRVDIDAWARDSFFQVHNWWHLCVFALKTDPAFALNFDPSETPPMRTQGVDKLSGSAAKGLGANSMLQSNPDEAMTTAGLLMKRLPSGMGICRRPSAAAVRALLVAANLPVCDLAEDLQHFFAGGSRASPWGVIGLELFGADALLRSLVVDPSRCGQGCGKALVAHAERYARNASVQRVFLLTETAVGFFQSLGYRVTPRELAPPSIQGAWEFSSLCPVSATFMSKALG